jgi:hypothetical protein
MPRNFIAYGFKGMHNLPHPSAIFIDPESKKISPEVALNVEVTDEGILMRRPGFSKKISLPGVHSLYGGSVFLAVAGGVLYQIEGVKPTAIATLPGPRSQLTYVEIDNAVYFSNPYFGMVFDLIKMATRSWGVPLPPAPTITMGPGDLPPGSYVLCYTQNDGGRLSGNGQMVTVTWEGNSQGIYLENLPANGQCWITHPNGQKLFLANLANGLITGQMPTAIPLPSLNVCPPPGFRHFALAFGRFWGIYGKKVLYSESFRYEWFRPAKFIPFIEELCMVAPVNEGVFVSSFDSTWFLDGTDPAKMTVRRIGEGAIPGTLVYATMPGAIVGGGYEISRKLSAMPSPVWISKTGYVVGTHTGHLVHLTESRLAMNPRSQGASLSRVKKGIPQIISSMYGEKVKHEGDPDLEQVFTNGQLF